MVSLEPGLWIASLLSIGYLSCTVKDNFFYRVAVEVLLGASMGNWTVAAYNTIKAQGVDAFMAGDYWLIIPIILGISLVMAVSARYGWVSRYGNAYLMGIGCGITGGSYIVTNIIAPIQESALPFTAPDVGGDPIVIIGRLILLISMVTTLAYFVLTIERKGYLRRIQGIGRYFIFLMLGIFLPQHQNWNLGAMQQMLQMIMYDWLGIPKPI